MNPNHQNPRRPTGLGFQTAREAIGPDFGTTFAQRRGFPTRVRGARRPRGDYLFTAPEEVLHNPVLRADLEALAQGEATDDLPADC